MAIYKYFFIFLENKYCLENVKYLCIKNQFFYILILKCESVGKKIKLNWLKNT